MDESRALGDLAVDLTLAGDAPICVYAILPAPGMEIPSIPGIDPGWSTYALTINAVQAIVSQVRAEKFTQAALESGLQDPVWIDLHVRAHQQVLDALVATGEPVIPLRFSTIYRDEAAVRSTPTAYEPSLVAEMERLRDQQEWGVKLFVTYARLQAAILSPDAEPGNEAFTRLLGVEKDATLWVLQRRIAGMSAGGAFLLQKKLDNLVAAKADDLVAAIVEESHTRLSGKATAETSLALHANPPGMVLNAAYLVAVQEFHAFRGGTGRLGRCLWQGGYPL